MDRQFQLMAQRRQGLIEYADCRHFHESTCRIGHADCHECRVCPKCGYRTWTDTGGVIDLAVTHASVLEIRVCTNCNKRTRGRVIRHSFETDNTMHIMCDVLGCNSRAQDTTWQTYALCDRHYDQIKSWRKRHMERATFPLFKVSERLKENPLYYPPERKKKNAAD